MTYSKIADDNYRKKCKTIVLKYTTNEIDEYNRIVKYCKDNDLAYRYDLDSKGIEYPTNV